MKDIYNELFGKEEPNLWYNEKIHNNLILMIHSYLNYKKASNFTDINEDGIQQEVQQLLKTRLTRSGFHSVREPNAFDQKRHDLLVLHSKSETPMVFYEIKTIIKEKEKEITPNLIYPDLIKLAIQKKMNPYCQVYFILAGKERVFKEAIDKAKTISLPNKFENKKSRASIRLSYEFLNEKVTHKQKHRKLLEKMKELNIEEISISPSRWKTFAGMAVITWKINRIK